MGAYIIAEAGVNHNGSFELAKKLIDAAAAAKADAVKFQTFIPEKVMSVYAKKAEYQVASTGGEESQIDMVRKLWLPYEDFTKLAAYCAEKWITFMSTPFDIPSLEFLHNNMDMPYLKIPSGEITNLPLLLAAASTEKPIIMSTGMAEIDEIAYARDVLVGNGCPEVILLHCNTEYPTPFEDANVRAMVTLRERFGGKVGYSDHTLGIAAPLAAAALGADVIEKHFTLDKMMEGPDHSASLEPDELIAMVEGIRNVETALGSGIKTASASEKKNADIARKSIVAACAIAKGETFTAENLDVKRPGNGVSPTKWFDVIGTKAVRDFKEDELIEL